MESLWNTKYITKINSYTMHINHECVIKVINIIISCELSLFSKWCTQLYLNKKKKKTENRTKTG
jgi:hypothetical protein